MLRAALPPVGYACEVALRAIRWILALRARMTKNSVPLYGVFVPPRVAAGVQG
jgi:hypothetical protein